jgi:hypothetical protein
LPRWSKIGIVFIVVAIGIAAGVIATHWPFTQASVTQGLEEAFASAVQIKSFRVTYFAPGCVLEGVTFRRNSDAEVTPIATVERLTIQGSYSGFFMFPKRIARVKVEGLHVFASPQSERAGIEAHPANAGSQTKVLVGEINADGAVLEFSSGDPGAGATKFEIHTLALDSVSDDGPMSFHATLKIPEPPGEIRTDGQFGPLNRGDVGQTVASGSYVFEHADLGVLPGLGGTLSSTGKFSGTLERLAVGGNTDTPDFNVTSGVHTVHLKTQFQAVVNGTNGDVSLTSVSAQFGHTALVARGEVAGKSAAAEKAGTAGKTISLTSSEQQGTIEDWLTLLAKKHHPAMNGAMTFQTQVQVPPGSRSFLERVNLQGDFEIGAADFTKPDTQAAVDNLSRVAQGQKQDENPESVFENMKGHVVMSNAVATLSDFYFGVPGALAHMHGTYGILTQKIDLHGNLRVDRKLSKGETGVKSVFLKVVEPLMKKKKAGEIVPIKIGGTIGQPSYGLDLVK